MDKLTQIKKIWRFLENHEEGLTTFEAVIKLRITNLPKRISEMLKDGYPISKTPEVKINADGAYERYMRYRKAA